MKKKYGKRYGSGERGDFPFLLPSFFLIFLATVKLVVAGCVISYSSHYNCKLQSPDDRRSGTLKLQASRRTNVLITFKMTKMESFAPPPNKKEKSVNAGTFDSGLGMESDHQRRMSRQRRRSSLENVTKLSGNAAKISEKKRNGGMIDLSTAQILQLEQNVLGESKDVLIALFPFVAWYMFEKNISKCRFNCCL